jgi:DNA-binding response OmpR family regulator
VIGAAPIVRVRGSLLEEDICARGIRRLGQPFMTRVLVVEDDPSVGAAIQMTLGREGCDTVHALDAGTGIRTFESSRFDLAIVDIFLPDGSGLKTIGEFHSRAPTVPILAISGFIFRNSMDPVLDYLAMAAQAGANVCLRKPFAPRQLIAAMYASLASVPAVLAFQKPGSGQDGNDDLGPF